MRRFLAALSVLCLCTFGSQFRGEPSFAVPAPSHEQARVVKMPRNPQHLRLWKFDAPVVSLQISNGELTPPPDPKVLGWWGRPAGAGHGTTLLAGHTVHTGGGTLDDLEKVPVGAIGSLSGVKYMVTRVEVISKAALARRAPSLFRQHGRPRVVLVTCEDYVNGEYLSNVVVTLHRL